MSMSRTFPLMMYDPEAGERIKDRLSLKGNPAVDKDWYVDPKTSERTDFVTFARGEGRFEKHFDKDGNASAALMLGNEDRRKNWRMLQELAGIEPEKPAPTAPMSVAWLARQTQLASAGRKYRRRPSSPESAA